jgi:hypothetical protein
MCPSHLNLSLIIAIESWIEPYCLCSLLFKIRTVKLEPKIIRRQFLWKTYIKSSSAFRGALVSEPYLTTVINVASNILVLTRKGIFTFLKAFLTLKKHPGLLHF